MIDRLSQVTSVVLAIASSLLVVIIMFLISVDVIRRSAGLGSIRGGSELAEVMLVAAAFLAIAYAQRTEAHVGTSLLTDRLPQPVALRLESIALIAMVAFFAWMTWETGARAWTSLETAETRFGVRQVPVWPARFAVAIGLFALTIEIALGAINRWHEASTLDAKRDVWHDADAPD